MKINKNQLGKGIYTNDSLIGGNNIEIVKKINPNVIDQNTFALFHYKTSAVADAGVGSTHPDFNTSYTRATAHDGQLSLVGAGMWASYTFVEVIDTVKHFGQNVGQLRGVDSTAPRLLTIDRYSNGAGYNFSGYITTGAMTIDVWAKSDYDDATNSVVAFSLAEQYDKTRAIKFRKNSATLYADASYDLQETNVLKTETLTTPIVFSDWNHYAFTYVLGETTGKCYGYVNGKCVLSYTDTTPLNVLRFGCSYYDIPLFGISTGGSSNSDNAYLQELRVTFADCYSGQDFDVPTEPYTEGGGMDVYQINNTQQEANVLDYYGTCDTAATERDKIVSCSGFSLKTGVSIRVKFTNAQNYNSSFLSKLRLNVNNTGLISVNSIGTTAAVRYCWAAGEVVAFTYDGTNWLIQKGGIAGTTYYGLIKLNNSATSTDTASALVPNVLNSVYNNVISNYPLYSSSSTYAVGDRVKYSYAVYECNTAIDTAESWTAAHWTQVDTLQEQIIANKAIAADTNLSNLTNAGKIVAANVFLPSNIYTDLTIGASGATYTAPANGWFWCGGIADNVQQNTRIVLRRTKDRFGMTANTNGTTASGGFVGAFLPVAQGEIVGLYYVNITADYGLRFFYAEGSKTQQ